MSKGVEWLKFKVGMFDGHSFKRIKRAKIDGVVDFRDKLIAVWFELIDLAGKVNNNGYYFNDDLAYTNYEEIAIMIDRTEKEVELCINWFIENNMMEKVNSHLLLSNFTKYQNNDGLERIREQNRRRQREYRKKQKNLLTNPETCVYCGGEANSKDHIIPKSKGGLDLLENLVPCCLSCNREKNNLDLKDFLNNRLLTHGYDKVVPIINRTPKLLLFVKYDKSVSRYVTLRNEKSLIDNNISYSNSNISNSLSIKDNNNIEELFNNFWKAYPRKVGKDKCFNWFKRRKVTQEFVNDLILAVKQQEKSKQWQNRQYIPHPYTWLNRGGWNDELDYVETPQETIKNRWENFLKDE
ncbi:MAG: phage replisome organizer N-terminal domain-containing protein [Acholeplasmataceae bacterium]